MVTLAALIVAVVSTAPAERPTGCDGAVADFRRAQGVSNREAMAEAIGYLERNCNSPHLAEFKVTLASTPIPVREPTPEDRLTAAASLPAAIGLVKGEWGASYEWDRGSRIFARYAQKQLTETNITKLQKTSLGLMQKDPDAELGKGMCFKGEVIEIYAEPMDGLKMYRGGLFDGEDVAQFLTPWGTDGIVKGVDATLCGVFTGMFEYTSTKGERVRAAKLVGAFRR